MGTSITERILGNTNLYIKNYLSDVILLAKSISIVNSKEADLYNEYIVNNYPNIEISRLDKTTWRYYKHLASEKHEADKDIELISIDNGEVLVLNPSSIILHRLTRLELLKFGLYYKELVDRYPEQELYIKSVISTSKKKTINEIISLEDYSIVSYNDDLVEENEDDLIQQLQIRIDNYKVMNLLPYYSLSDNLFMTTQYHILYNFIFKTILALRLANAKTLKAHSHHILNYLSSHHYLDGQYNYLTKKQALFLYRNLLYLDNHAGQNKIFQLLIDKLFTDRNISVINYNYSQSNTLDDKSYVTYKFKQKLLNKSNLVYSYKDYKLPELIDKEISLAPSNDKELKYNFEKLNTSLKNSLFNSLLTKDLESIVIDNTDTVKYKLIPTMIDYWAYLLKTKKMKYLVSVLDPLSNKALILSTKDLFKLFILVLFKSNGQTLETFPDYTIQRVYKPTLPETDELYKAFYMKRYYQKDIINLIKSSVPRYNNYITSFQFEQYITSIYRLNIGIWLYLSNITDKDDNAQYEAVVSKLHLTDTYNLGEETPNDFLKRIGLEYFKDYTQQALDAITFSILNNLYDGKLTFINKYKFIQKALIDVFSKFNSYTVQMIDNYSSEAPILVGPRDTRLTLDQSFRYQSHIYEYYTLDVDTEYRIKNSEIIDYKDRVLSGYSYHTDVHMDINPSSNVGYHSSASISLNICKTILNGLDNDNWLITPASEEHLQFLAFNA